ncbi:hypothetical protein HEK616_23430 [Streptomyces nigrescens]|uniref:Secreted protein n=2 Tax=Streptomyces TaxID=1883 RepID=A0ABN6QVA4_STRNI|nr:hypothetical protein [Streptomyces nigrescens]MEE4425047.1 hypothetical protein [Streptomyces sp. DSM 41528]BDM68856.1 hypothetical protein HEK616_23430 [Streptomyces nigrescens]
MRLVPRLAAALSGLALALGGVVAVAPAAHATPQACFYTVLEQHPGANPEVVERACHLGAEGGPEAARACYFELRRDYVPAVVAFEACRRAAEEE